MVAGITVASATLVCERNRGHSAHTGSFEVDSQNPAPGKLAGFPKIKFVVHNG
jgi:hypothetical protein